MEYELENIEAVVARVLNLILSGNFKIEEFQKIKDFLSTEYQRIDKVFRRKVISGGNEYYFKEYFTIHQVGVIGLIDQVFWTYSNLSSHKEKYSSLFEVLLATHEKFLSCIRNQYPNYFNLSIKAPEHFISKARQELSNNLEALFAIRDNQYIDNELIDPVISTLQVAIEPRDNGLTFKQLQYLKMLQKEICQIDFSFGDINWGRLSLSAVLIKLNYNDPQFFKFYTEYINKALLSCETLTDRIDQTAYFYKTISQTTVTHGVALNDSDAQMKRQLLEWISHELDYLHQKQGLQLSSKDSDLIKKDFKIVFDLSVSQLAYLFKTFIEMDIIQNKNMSEVIRFLAKFVKTKKTESVSYESLRIKFYNTECGTKDAVKKTFQSLLSYINRN